MDEIRVRCSFIIAYYAGAETPALKEMGGGSFMLLRFFSTMIDRLELVSDCLSGGM